MTSLFGVLSMTFFSEYLAESKRQRDRGRCLHFSDGVRCNEIISAHSIQKRGQLGLIAENGHVYRFNADPSTLRQTDDGMPQPKMIGINKASAFLGFCKQHDNSLFELIDNEPLKPNKLQIALYAYRCLCREYFVKENAVNVFRKFLNHPELDLHERTFLESCFRGNTHGLNGLKHHKNQYENAIQNNLFDEFEFTYFTSKSRCSLQLSGLLYPDYDFLGQKLQDLGNWGSPLDLITFFTAPTDDGWAFGFGWHRSSHATCAALVQSLASQVSFGSSLADAVVRLSLSCCENHAFRMSWWDGLPLNLKQCVIKQMHLMVNPATPVPSNYLTAGMEGLADWNFEYVQTTLSVNA